MQLVNEYEETLSVCLLNVGDENALWLSTVRILGA